MAVAKSSTVVTALPPTDMIRSPLRMPARSAATLFDGVDQQTVTLRQPYGVAKATSHPRRGESNAKAHPVGRFSASQRVHAGFQVLPGGQRQVEPLAGPMSVDPYEVPFGIDDRPARRAVGQGGAVLERSGDRPAFRAPEREAQPGDKADASRASSSHPDEPGR